MPFIAIGSFLILVGSVSYIADPALIHFNSKFLRAFGMPDSLVNFNENVSIWKITGAVAMAAGVVLILVGIVLGLVT
ncbi:MAG: hypothetical protein AAF266_12560 [Planctomycetota bacterium]